MSMLMTCAVRPICWQNAHTLPHIRIYGEEKKNHNLDDVLDGKIDIQKPISDLTLIIQVKRSIFQALSSISPADCWTVIVSVFHRFITASNENIAGKTGKYLNRRGRSISSLLWMNVDVVFFCAHMLSLYSLCTFVLFVVYLVFWLMLHGMCSVYFGCSNMHIRTHLKIFYIRSSSVCSTFFEFTSPLSFERAIIDVCS